MTQAKPNTIEGLAQFTGTEHYYFSPPFSNFNYTDGVKYLADKAGAHWFKDAVFGTVMEMKLAGKDADWIAAKLTVNDNNSAVITFEDGNCNILKTQEIEFTDFPTKTAEIWVIDGVAILPSEY